MPEPQLKIRIRLDQSADSPDIGQHSPDMPEVPDFLAPLPPEYEYNWARIIGAGAALLFVLIVIIWAVSDLSSDEETLEKNEAEVVLPTTSSVASELSVMEPAQSVVSTEHLSDQLPENNSGDSQISLKNEGSDHSTRTSNPSSKRVSQVPVKPGIKPAFSASRSKSRNNPQAINRSSGLIKSQLTSNIRHRQPVDSIDRVSLNGKLSRSIFLFLHLSQLKGEKIFINWYYRNKSVAKVSLLIGNNDWHTYSSKVLNQNRLGPWRVTASDQTGKLLTEFKFNVTR